MTEWVCDEGVRRLEGIEGRGNACVSRRVIVVLQDEAGLERMRKVELMAIRDKMIDRKDIV